MNSISITKDLDTTYCLISDLIALLKLKTPTVGRKNSLSIGEVATISLIKANYDITTWKGLYKLLNDKYQKEFNLPCYKNFVVTMNKYSWVLALLINILLQINNRKSGTIKLVDSTPLPVCHNMRIWHHQTMKKFASRCKGTMGWYYGLKLHAMCDTKGNLIAIRFTTATTGDREVLDQFLDQITDSIVVADAGYISKKLEEKAGLNNNVLKTCSRCNMRKIATLKDIGYLNMRNRIEVLFSVLKERLNIVTSLPRSTGGYFAHYIHVIFGYMFSKLIS